MIERELTVRQAIVIIEAREFLRVYDMGSKVAVNEMSDSEVLARMTGLAQELIPALRRTLALMEMILQREQAAES